VEEAEALFRSALDAQRVDGSSPAEILATESSLALTVRLLGRYAEAASIYETVIEQALESSGGDSLGVASDLLGLGQAYQFQERHDDAARLFRTVRRLKEDAGAHDAQLARAIHDLGVVLADQEQHAEAEIVHEEALTLWRRLFPGGHPEIARSLEAIARVVERQGRWAEADSIYRKAIDSWSTLYGDDHTQIATIRVNQANLRYFEGDFDAAAEAYREGIRIWRAGGERGLLGTAIRNLAVIDRERGDYASADTLLSEALELRRELSGERSSAVAEVYSSLAGLRNRQGRYAEAEDHARAALALYEELLEPGHRLTLNAGLELAEALVQQGRYDQAVPLLRTTRQEFAQSLNEADARRGRVDLWLGSSLARLGDVEEARALLTAAVPVLEAGLGADAPESRRARRELASLPG
jgi:tetratricopeptide (TPR) repeat protein